MEFERYMRKTTFGIARGSPQEERFEGCTLAEHAAPCCVRERTFLPSCKSDLRFATLCTFAHGSHLFGALALRIFERCEPEMFRGAYRGLEKCRRVRIWSVLQTEHVINS